jgi:hypothetical protein
MHWFHQIPPNVQLAVKYVVLARLALLVPMARARVLLFALANVYLMRAWFQGPRPFVYAMATTLVCYALTRLFARRDGAVPWVAFAFPILTLIFVRYLSPSIGDGDR